MSFVIFLSNICISQEKWSQFESDQFTILAPGKLEKKTKKITTEMGEVNTINYSLVFEKEHPNYLYTINVIEYPTGTINKDSLATIQEMINETLSGLEENLQSKIQYTSSLDIDYTNGYIFRMINETKGLITKGKIIVFNDYLYTLMVYTTKEKSLNREMDKFLDSFKIL